MDNHKKWTIRRVGVSIVLIAFIAVCIRLLVWLEPKEHSGIIGFVYYYGLQAFLYTFAVLATGLLLRINVGVLRRLCFFAFRKVKESIHRISTLKSDE